MKKTILSTALLVLGVAFMACNFPIVKENWPMGGGPNGNFKVTTTGKVPLHWSVRNDKNIQWKLTLPEGGQSGIAVWEDKLFFTLNISKENLPLATLQSKLENFEQLYQTEMKRLEAAYLKDKKSKLSKYKVALENASKKWEDFLANHKKYQETKANIRVRMQKNLQQHTEPGNPMVYFFI